MVRYSLDTRLRTALIAVICSAGIAGSLLLFRYDLNRTQKILDEKPAGTVYWTDKSAQCLPARRLQWARLERNSPVYDGDTVSTAALSEVKIKFANGETLELFENSSVRIRYGNGEKPLFEFYGGEILAQSGRAGLEINVGAAGGGASQTAFAASANLAPGTYAGLNAIKGCTFRVYQGEGSLSSGENTRRIGAGESLKTGENGIFLPDPPMMMLSPRNGTRILRTSGEEGPVQFNWRRSGSGGDGGVWLEISDTRDFSNLTGSWYEGSGESIEVSLPEGLYYWKAFVPPSPEEVDSGRLDIVRAPGPRAVFPANDSVVLTENPELRFYWTVPKEAEAVLLEVAANPDMIRPRLRQLIRESNSGGGGFVSSDIGPGRWYWRIHPVYPGWLSEGDALSSQMGAGQNFWRVRPVNASVIADDLPSLVNSFTLENRRTAPKERLTRPLFEAAGDTASTVFPPDNYTLEAGRTPDLVFSWKNPLRQAVKIQIAERSDFTGPLIMNDDVYGSDKQGIFLYPGIYYWRITGTEKDSGIETVPARLVVTPSLFAPRLENPADNERLIIEEGKPVNFTWERVNYANFYKFSLFLDERELQLSGISSLQNNSVMVYFDPGTAGRFYWTVQGFSMPTEISSGRNGLIARNRFSITPQGGASLGDLYSWTVPRIANIQTYSGELFSPITLVSPASGINIPGIQALRSPPLARWTTEEPLRNVQLIISRSSDPASDPRAIVMEARGATVSFPSLDEGIWYWIICGDTSDTRGATPREPFWINVLPVPLLPASRPIQPENNAVIDLAQLTRDRKITFSWSEVPAASAYIFSLFQDGNPPTLLFTLSPEMVFSYDLENLSILNDGNYLWQVEAVYRNNSGVIEQRGRIERHPFTIEIQRSANLQTHSQGTLYGQ